MCFDSLPIEFDESGEPSLADDAENVTQPGTDDQVGVGEGRGCAPDAEAAIDAAPEAAYDAILSAVPETARSQVIDAATETDAGTGVETDGRRGRTPADGD
ncbi:hypothetical protein BRC90_06265 [Halobacteriales archaeon QS_4_69_34]|nr:MAG: hypothetical protein BRC90_06265 [Halobacteriales archaeon QS_4_69_34]